jgi:hypothetical protein
MLILYLNIAYDQFTMCFFFKNCKFNSWIPVLLKKLNIVLKEFYKTFKN